MPLQSPAVLKRPVKNRTLKKVSLPVSVDFQYSMLTAPPCVPERVSAVVPLYITARDHLTNRYVGDDDGDIIYPLVREGLLAGRKVILSVKGLAVYSSFFKTAICRAYEEFPESTVDRDIEVTDMARCEAINLEEMKALSKSHDPSRPTCEDWHATFCEMLINGEEGELVSPDAEIEELPPDMDLSGMITMDEFLVRFREGCRERHRKVNEWK